MGNGHPVHEEHGVAHLGPKAPMVRADLSIPNTPAILPSMSTATLMGPRPDKVVGPELPVILCLCPFNLNRLDLCLRRNHIVSGSMEHSNGNSLLSLGLAIFFPSARAVASSGLLVVR